MPELNDPPNEPEAGPMSSETNGEQPSDKETAPVLAPVLPAGEIAAERERGRKAAFAATASALLVLASIGVVLSSGTASSKAANTKLIEVHEHATANVVGAILIGLAYLLAMPLIVHLARAAKDRGLNVPSLVKIFAVVGPVALSVGAVIYAFKLNDASAEFAQASVRTVAAAEERRKDLGKGLAPIVASVGQLAFIFSLMLSSVYAMRVGLLTKFIGVIGALTGALLLVVNSPATILFAFWLGSVSMMLLGSPERQPPAWRAGTAIPWPKGGIPVEDDSQDGDDEAEKPAKPE